MAGKAGDTAGEVILGPMDVVADPETIARFRSALGAAAADIPATFPVVWLGRPAVREALRPVLGPGLLLIHESQSFDYERPLKSGARYVLTGVARRESERDRLIVAARAHEADAGVLSVTMQSVLRLVGIAGDRTR